MHKWLAAIQKGLGLPKRDKVFVLPVHIRCVMQLPRDTLRRTRDAAILVVGTVCELRSGEVSKLDVCDLLWDIDGIGTLALLLWCRKNDCLKRGLFPRMRDAGCVTRDVSPWIDSRIPAAGWPEGQLGLH
eukprot:234251-Rhodomonas_salina.1